MRKLFTERSRLVIYLELSDLTRLTAKARSEGQTVVEWVREVLLGEIEQEEVLQDKPKKATAIRRVIEAAEGTSEASAEIRKAGKTCKHGTAKGYNCWQCGGIAVIE